MIKKDEISKIGYSLPIIKNLLKLRANYIWRKQASQDPKINANRIYKNVFGKDINWENPTNLIEKIYWLEIFSDTSLWSVCADKYKIREFIESKGLIHIMPKLYGHWDNAEEIKYDKLPNSFVLKTTNGCGQVILIKDKKQIDIPATNKLLNQWLNLKYGYTDGQIHYSRIKPCIIAEEYLNEETEWENVCESKNENFTSTKSGKKSVLKNYKIWCFNGKPECILVAYDRIIGEKYSLSMFDCSWKNISTTALKPNGPHYGGKDIERPKNFGKMLEYSEILSQSFPEVRVDFYEVNGIVYLGEMTFSTGYGSYKKSFYEYLGSKIDLSKVHKNAIPNKLKV